MKRVIYRPSCYTCHFAGPKRVGDITLADFWGIDKDFLRENGHETHVINMLMTNTKKGSDNVEQQPNVVKKERSLGEAIEGIDTLKANCKKNYNYDEFYLSLGDGFDKGVHTIYKKHYSHLKIGKIKSVIATALGPLYFWLKKVMGGGKTVEVERFNSVNLLLINTSKGVDLIGSLPNVVLKKRTLKEAVKGNDTLKHPTSKPDLFSELFKFCEINRYNR